MSGHVAVIGGEPLRLLRRIPTGAGAYDMALGGGYLWVVNAEAGTLSAVDLARLKVQRTLPLARGARPLSVVYVGEEQGLAAGRVIVGDAQGGSLYIVRADRMIAGDGAASIEGVAQVGGSLTALAASAAVAAAPGVPARPSALYVADIKSRAVWTTSLNALVVSPSLTPFTRSEGLHFAPQDLALTDEGVWVTTGDNLWFSGYDALSFTALDLPASRLAPLDGRYLEGPGFAISDGARLDNYLLTAEGDLEALVGVNGARVQRIAPFLLRAPR